MDVNQHMIGFTENKSTNHRFYCEYMYYIFRKFSPAGPSENYHLKLRSIAVAVAAVAAAEAVANWESRLRRQT